MSASLFYLAFFSVAMAGFRAVESIHPLVGGGRGFTFLFHFPREPVELTLCFNAVEGDVW